MTTTSPSIGHQHATVLPGRDLTFTADVRNRAKRLLKLNDHQLQSAANDFREDVTMTGFDGPHLLDGFALAYEALRRTLGIELYDVQLIGARALAENRIAEMQTGEGKTFTAVPAAVSRGLTGQGVHVANPNSYLAERDFRQLQPVFDVLGISSGLLPERVEAAEKLPAYRCDVTYGTGYEFGFDYLRDQLALRKQSRRELGQSLVDTLNGVQASQDEVCQRGLIYAIIDEADNVLIDDASSPLVLAESSAETAADADAVRIARYVASLLDAETHYRKTGPQNVELTEDGRQRVHRDDVSIPVKQLIRPWTQYVEQALRANILYCRDVHYVVQDDAIQIVDGSTGRIFSDRTWQGGLHQAIEAKERLAISTENETLAQITRQRFYRLYHHLAGMTGTATNCVGELETVYHLPVETIPPRLPSRREILPMRFFSHADHKWRAIAAEVERVRSAGRPVLIGTRSIAESLTLSELLESQHIPFQLLNGKQDSDEAAIVSRAGISGCVTIATNLAGRGTDIKIPSPVQELGGLHVIVTECHDSARVDRQLVGRSARQGQPGSAQAFVSADDWLLCHYGEWLANALRKNADSMGEVRANLESRVRRIQLAAERAQYAARAAMFRRDLESS